MQPIGKFTTFSRATHDDNAFNKIVSKKKSLIEKNPNIGIIHMLRSTKWMTIYDVIMAAAKYNVDFQFDPMESSQARMGFTTSYDEVEAALALMIDIGLASRQDETPAEYFERTKKLAES